MKIDRDVQRRVLDRLAADYPQEVNADFLYSDQDNPHHVIANVAYLEEHGLIAASYYGPKGRGNAPLTAVITAKGMDFLADDGGLGAILGVMTIRVHEDSLKQLLAAKIDAAGLPPQEKKAFLDQLQKLPGKATEHLVLKLVDAGLDNWQKAWPLLQGILS